MLHFIYTVLFSKNKRIRFLTYHIASIVIFSLLYWSSNIFIESYPEFSKKSGLGYADPQPKSLFYWLYFSAITQTTIGYSGPVEDDGSVIPYSTNKNNGYKLINMCQILSIFGITALLLDP